MPRRRAQTDLPARKVLRPEELEAFAKRRHGARRWLVPMADELGIAPSTVWRMSKGRIPIQRYTELAIEALELKDKMRKLIGVK